MVMSLSWYRRLIQFRKWGKRKNHWKDFGQLGECLTIRVKIDIKVSRQPGLTNNKPQTKINYPNCQTENHDWWNTEKVSREWKRSLVTLIKIFRNTSMLSMVPFKMIRTKIYNYHLRKAWSYTSQKIKN